MTIVVSTNDTDPNPYVFVTAHTEPAVLWIETLPANADTLGFGPWNGTRGLLNHREALYVAHIDSLETLDSTDPLWPVIVALIGPSPEEEQ
jgi:hypothetical protein